MCLAYEAQQAAVCLHNSPSQAAYSASVRDSITAVLIWKKNSVQKNVGPMGGQRKTISINDKTLK